MIDPFETDAGDGLVRDYSLDESASYWTLTRVELRRWFEDRIPSFAAAYVGAVELLHQPTFPGRVHFICHVVRDIYKYLPKALGSSQTTKSFGQVFPQLIHDLRACWEKQPESLSQFDSKNTDETIESVSVSVLVHRHVRQIVDASRSMKAQTNIGTLLAQALFQAHERSGDSFIPARLIDTFNREHNWFVKRAHLRTSRDKMVDDDGLLEHFESFERAFHALIGAYFTGNDELDAILQDTNPSTD